MVKIKIGSVFITFLFLKMEELMEQFKNVHRELQQLKVSGFSTAELKRDINAIEEERDLVTRRIERLRQKTESIPNQSG